METKIDIRSVADTEKKLSAASLAYYAGDPIMTDAEFDTLWNAHKESRAVRPEDPMWADTILDRVGAPEMVTDRIKIPHKPPMMSLDNVFVGDGGDLGELDAWVGRTRLALGSSFILGAEPKLDGLSLRVVYYNGKLMHAATRGDGEQGEVVTRNALAAELVPVNIGCICSLELSLNGEVYIKQEDFVELNKEQRDAGAPEFANPRNAAAGIIRRISDDGGGMSYLSFRAFEMHVSTEEIMTEERQANIREHLHAYGISWAKSEAFRSSHDFLQDGLADNLHKFASSCGCPTDGVVFKVLGAENRRKLGVTSRAPKWAIALKFEQEVAVTTLNDISVQVGRTGVLTPVAELEPVEIDGTIVSRATLHNQTQINKLRLKVGDRVQIRKAGAIIPEILSSVTANARASRDDVPFDLGAHVNGCCPACGSSDISTRGSLDEAAGKTPVVWMCNDDSCKARLAARIEHMGSRKCLDIDQLGAEVCEAIAARAPVDLITHPFQILSKGAEWFAALTWYTDSGGRMTFGSGRAEAVVEAIGRARTLPLNRWITALGIHTIGENTGKEISRLVTDGAQLIEACTAEPGRVAGLFWRLYVSRETKPVSPVYEELKSRYGVSHHLGPVSIKHLVDYVNSEEGRALINSFPLSVQSNNFAPEPGEVTGKLAGKKFVITGTLSVSRGAVKTLIEVEGGIVSSSLSAKTDVLVAGEKAGSKLKKAGQLDVTVWDEDRLRKEIE